MNRILVSLLVFTLTLGWSTAALAGYCGPEVNQGYQLSPRYQIPVNTNGFNESHPDARCRIKLDYIDQAVDVQIARWSTQGKTASQVVTQLRKNRVVLRSNPDIIQTTPSGSLGNMTQAITQISVTDAAGTATFCFSGDASSKPLIHEWDHSLAYAFGYSYWAYVGPGHLTYLGNGVGYNIDGTVMQPYSPVPDYQTYCVDPPKAALRFDFDGNGKANVAVFRPSDGIWYIRRTDGTYYGPEFGQSGDIPAAADYDGDGQSDPAVFRGGVWYRLQSTAGVDIISFGQSADIPAAADYDADGEADIAVFRPSNGTWYILQSSDGQASIVQFGSNGDIPVAGDFDGDGKADISLFRPSTGEWHRLNSSNGAYVPIQFGANGDKPVSGDFDGDGKADPAVFRPSNGTWYILASSTGAMQGGEFGSSGDIPVPADYDGDGKDDFAVFRPSTGFWYLINSGDNSVAVFQFGFSTDIPVAALP